MKMTKVFSFSQRSMLAHKFSASKIAETELENRFSNLLHLVVDKRLLLLHLICLFLVFRLRCCNGFSLSSQQASCVMAAPSPPRCFAAWRVEAFFFFCFLLRWVLRLAAFVIRGFTLHGSSSCFREDSLDDCGRPCDPFLGQEAPSVKDVDPTCSTTSLFGDATCFPVGSMFLDWPINPCGRSDPSGPSLPLGALNGAQQRGAFPATGHSRWRQGALHAQPQILQRATGWDGCGPFLTEVLRCITWNTRGLVGSVLQDKGTENPNSNILKNSCITTTSFVFRSCMERTSFFKLFRCWLRDFDSLLLFF